jgi:hypothetical protein
MRQLADDTRKVTDAGESWTGTLGKAQDLLGLLGISLTAGAFVALTREIFADADALVKLHDKTDISIEDLQRLRAIGEDAGVSLDSMAAAALKLDTKLGMGDAGANGALAELHINVKNFLALDSAKQFFAIAEAVKEIDNPIDRARVLSELYGKSWSEMVPVLKQAVEDHQRSLVVMSRDSVTTIDSWGDMWHAFWRDFKATAGESWADVLTLSLSKTRALRSSFSELIEGVKPLHDIFSVEVGLPADLEAITKKFDAQAKVINENMTPAAIAFRAAMVELNSVGVGWEATLDTINGSVVEGVQWYLKAGISQEKLATAYGLTAAQVKAVASGLHDELEMQKLVADVSTSRLNTEIAGLQTLFGIERENADAEMQRTMSDADFKIFKIQEQAQARKNSWQGPLEFAAKYFAQVDAWAARQVQQVLDGTKQVEQAIVTLIGGTTEETKKAAEALGVTVIGGANEIGAANQKAAADTKAGYSIAFHDAGGGFAAFKGAVLQGNNEMIASAFGLASAYANVMNPIGTPKAVGGQRVGGGGEGEGEGASGFRAAGGPVASGSAYVVGERGPELFVPDRAGSIVPNGGGVTVHAPITITVNGSVLSGKRELAAAVGDALMTELRALGTRFPSR